MAKRRNFSVKCWMIRICCEWPDKRFVFVGVLPLGDGIIAGFESGYTPVDEPEALGTAQKENKINYQMSLNHQNVKTILRTNHLTKKRFF